ncbi:DUF2064 domain-containing protein [Actinobacteria bacterium YIM 96077]|uniref:Glycosyltransferase n=1 Tax=Phytoactinopolyspora halophila TaxID=1981511 RepID=A0A329QP30_9ACTN|nr:DUF2064 domain-containing protein [Phytoactinopolyspora halophila]AYY15676.1 DUF2064 domain-containing protein [Actinobacteria bacterium YIM 96077]RAW14137.1 glycosyltransferase [Phytoactinopolyspora halophila]
MSHVLVLAKAPVPGYAKTRLCPRYSAVEATEIATAALADTLETIARCDVDRRILALDGQPGPWLPSGFEIVHQVSGSLNERLAAAWAHAGGPGIQIGMDTPQITAELIHDSLATVLPGPADAALGPAEDGGWWAIAASERDPGVLSQMFHGVPMSSQYTARAQAARLRSLGMTVRTMRTLRDLDDADDARAIAALIPGSHTATAVDSIGDAHLAARQHAGRSGIGMRPETAGAASSYRAHPG